MFQNDFKPMCVGDLIDTQNKFNFIIPSFQRGYRWEDKQVEDLLEDLDRFVNGNNNQGSVYYLQPLIVCKIGGANNSWYLLDGQQRLTTMCLVLLNLKRFAQQYFAEDLDNGLYDLEYESRAAINFSNPDKDTDINNYYIYNANECIKKWINRYISNDSNGRGFLSRIIETLSNKSPSSNGPQHNTDNMKFVKFIWFDISYSNPIDVMQQIEVYNRFNSNKIKLTPSELIKALYVLEAKNNARDVSDLLNTWNSIEKQFQNDKFWHLFGADDTQTRIDYLFNAVAKNYSNEDKDKDKAYRDFQKKYDEQGEGLKNDWEEAKRIFNLFVQCYEDIILNNYFGLLIFLKEKPNSIIEIISNESKDYGTRLDDLRNTIKTKIWGNKKVDINDISQLTYEDNKEMVKKVLLLHNIETCNVLKQKFDFDSFYREKWEIEHVDPQNRDNFTSNDQIKEWLGYVKPALTLFPRTDENVSLMNDCDSYVRAIESGQFRNNQMFQDYVNSINIYFSEKDADGNPVPFDSDEKQKLWNLALLDKTTNIAFSNSPFPSKRQILIETKLNLGEFVPICTERLFLKYYAFTTGAGSLDLDFLHWTRNDREHYIEDVGKKLAFYLR